MAAVGSGRAAGWDKLTAAQMTLLKDKFVAYAPRWGSTGYVTQDNWKKETSKKGQAAKHANRIGGTYWSIVTASGEPVVSEQRTLEAALAAFAQLPEKERRPEIEDRGAHNPNLPSFPDQAPPPSGMFVKVYCRALEPSGDTFKIARTVDLTEFGGRPSGNSMPGHLHEPQREWLWLTQEEAQSLAPGARVKGESYEFPAAIRQRIFLFYLYNWFTNSGGGYWGPRLLKNGNLTLTVVDRAGDKVRLRLDGAAHFQGLIGKGNEAHGGNMFGPSAESGQKGVPDPYEIFYDARLYGELEYDTAQKKFMRFDAAALGDYRGNWGLSLKVKPVPVGFAFELDPRDLPAEGRHAPFALSALKDHYWKADQWTGKK